MSKVCPTLATHWVQIKSPKKDSGFTWVQSHRSKPLCLPATITKWHQPVKAGMGTETWCQVGTSTDVYGTNGMCMFLIFCLKHCNLVLKFSFFCGTLTSSLLVLASRLRRDPEPDTSSIPRGMKRGNNTFWKKGFFWHTEEQFCCKVVAFLNNNQF